MHDTVKVQRISVFDLDRTLTRRPTYFLFLLRGAVRYSPARLLFLPLIVMAMIAHKLGLLARKPLKEFMQRSLLGSRFARRRLLSLTDDFVDRLIHDGLCQPGLAQIEADRAEGRMIVMATAAPHYYAEAIGERLSVDAVVSTRCSGDAQHLFARLDGLNCYGPDKRDAVAQWLRQYGWSRERVHIRFYSDDRSDLPCFEWCDEPVIVNARRSFNKVAIRQGWTTADWR